MILIDFALLDAQMTAIEPHAADGTTELGRALAGLLGLIDGIKDSAVEAGVPYAEVFPRLMQIG